MLHVALAPAPVALELVDQRRRALFVAAGEIAGEPDFPARASHQRRFDKVMAHDLAAERRPAPQAGKAAVLDKRLDAENRVMAPVGALAQLPIMETGGEHRSVGVVRELLHAGEERFAID